MAAILEELNNEPPVSNHQKCHDLVVAYWRLSLTKVKPSAILEELNNEPPVSNHQKCHDLVVAYWRLSLMKVKSSIGGLFHKWV